MIIKMICPICDTEFIVEINDIQYDNISLESEEFCCTDCGKVFWICG